MEIDYDTHLKPATAIKKTQGEDATIKYLFDLFSSQQWSDYDKLSILQKMRGYYRKANLENKTKILNELTTLCNKPGNKYKSECYSTIAEVHEIEKDDENSYLMLSAAVGYMNPEASNYLLAIAQYTERQLPILVKKDLTNVGNAYDYLYWMLSQHLYQMAWYETCIRNGSRVEEIYIWSQRVSETDFPFDNPPSITSLKTLFKDVDIESYSRTFRIILFDNFAQEFVALEHSCEAVDSIEKIVKDYLDF